MNRRLFDRAVSLNLSAKKIKYFYKRYLQFEKDFGDETAVERVKESARQYVSSKIGGGQEANELPQPDDQSKNDNE